MFCFQLSVNLKIGGMYRGIILYVYVCVYMCIVCVCVSLSVCVVRTHAKPSANFIPPPLIGPHDMDVYLWYDTIIDTCFLSMIYYVLEITLHRIKITI